MESAAMASAGDGTGLRLAELIMSLSMATDLGTGKPQEWGLASCLLALRLGERLGLDDGARRDIYYVALLRWIGCTAESEMGAALFGDKMTQVGTAMATLDPGRPDHLLRLISQYVGVGQPPLQRLRTVARLPTAMAEVTRSHCEVAQSLAERLGFSAGVQAALWQTAEQWDGRGLPRRLKGEAILLPARVVALAQDAETLRRLGGVELAVRLVRERA